MATSITNWSRPVVRSLLAKDNPSTTKKSYELILDYIVGLSKDKCTIKFMTERFGLDHAH